LLLEDPAVILGDIRDAARMDEVFATYRPEVVFHTAALKHLPLLEMYPDEGWKTNVCGTLNLLRAAGAHGVDRFVNVSTDKAANPSSVLGWTKRITERLTAHANQTSDT
jgi:FlaA1/EpsC-like NDP-sugar epimerase